MKEKIEKIVGGLKVYKAADRWYICHVESGCAVTSFASYTTAMTAAKLINGYTSFDYKDRRHAKSDERVSGFIEALELIEFVGAKVVKR